MSCGSCGVSALTLSQVGPEVCPSSNTQNQVTQNKTCVNPETDLKGSINQAGGGGGGGSGCGKPAPCGGCSKKSSGCGGGGGGCGGSKKQNPPAVSFKVVFKDYNGKQIGSVQNVEKNSSATAPWEDDSTAKSKYPKQQPQPIDQYIWQDWSTHEYSNVQKDLEVNAVHRKLENYSRIETDVKIWDNILDTETQQKIQNFSNQCTQTYNEVVDECIDCISNTQCYITGQHLSPSAKSMIKRTGRVDYPGMMDILWEHHEECLNWPKFNDIKKCVLNIQSCYIFQTRLLFNESIDNNYKFIKDSIDELCQLARDGKKIDERLKELEEEFDMQIYDIIEDNKESYEQFKSDLSKYIDEINSCFPVPYVEKI